MARKRNASQTFIKVCDTDSYSFSVKNGNTIYETWGNVPNFLEIANGS